MKAALNAPSAKIARKWFGNRNATKNASASGPAPRMAASITSRAKAEMRDNGVKPPGAVAKRPIIAQSRAALGAAALERRDAARKWRNGSQVEGIACAGHARNLHRISWTRAASVADVARCTLALLPAETIRFAACQKKPSSCRDCNSSGWSPGTFCCRPSRSDWHPISRFWKGCGSSPARISISAFRYSGSRSSRCPSAWVWCRGSSCRSSSAPTGAASPTPPQTSCRRCSPMKASRHSSWKRLFSGCCCSGAIWCRAGCISSPP